MGPTLIKDIKQSAEYKPIKDLTASQLWPAVMTEPKFKVTETVQFL
jgi:hypothetical protein